MTEAMEKLIVTRKIVHCKEPLQERTRPDKPTMLLRMREDKAGKPPNPLRRAE